VRTRLSLKRRVKKAEGREQGQKKNFSGDPSMTNYAAGSRNPAKSREKRLPEPRYSDTLLKFSAQIAHMCPQGLKKAVERGPSYDEARDMALRL